MDHRSWIKGEYVYFMKVIKYPNHPPNKLTGLYRDPLIIVDVERPDVITVEDIILNKVIKVHTIRLHLFRHPTIIFIILSRISSAAKLS